MKTEYTVKEGNSRLLLIFAGWGTDPELYRGINPKGFDVAVAWDYSDLTFSFDSSGYLDVCVLAWSLGVYAASKVLEPGAAAMAVAVNGTMHPVDDRLGIPEAIFRGTMDSLDVRNLIKFRKRMSGDAYGSMENRLPEPDIEKLKMALDTIAKDATGPGVPHFKWDRAYISAKDAIFPPGNQTAAWADHPETDTVTLDGNHYTDLGEIVSHCIPDAGEVGKRFENASETYCDNATVQSRIASELACMAMDALGFRKEIGRMVDVGAGNGTLSRELAKGIRIHEADYIDLFKTGDIGIADTERFHVCDAEDWMEREAAVNPSSRDLIVSSSAMQWFVNPHRFFRNASVLLRPGGVFAVATFLPGNMGELAEVNPHGLLYRSETTLREFAERYFDDVHSAKGDIVMEFGNARDALFHLKATGVGGGQRYKGSVTQLLKSMPGRLTYRPLWVTARKGNGNS